MCVTGLLNLDTQKNKQVNSHDSPLLVDENLIDHRSIDDLVGPSAIILDHQPSSIIVDSQQVTSHQQEQAISQSSKQLESSLLQELLYQQKLNEEILIKK
ncbi:hypothetical protein H4Q26_007410 [Puccinia striiformis f. sp. tritici PST-130]|nr:hypothetical protein H4Q26_007410 [Puccinia striiformis f. sp. tritici PST-130]